MRKLLVLAVAFAVALVGSIGSAQALLDHTWVASNGLNGNPCLPSQPCADFATAYSRTNANGEIGCVDSGQFGPVTITKAITIDCIGVQASVLAASGTDGITVTVPGGTKVMLRGLDIQGLTSGNSGIGLTQGGILHVEQCVIRGFLGEGIALLSTNATELYMTDTSVVDDGGSGINVAPSGGPVVNVVLDRVHVSNNFGGVVVFGNSGATTRLQMTNSTVSGNGFGVFASTGAQPTTVVVANSLVSANNNTGVSSNGSATAVILNGNTITNNGTAMSAGSGGAIFSYGNNAVNDNGSPGSAPTPVALR